MITSAYKFSRAAFAASTSDQAFFSFFDSASLQTTVRVDPYFTAWYFSQDCFDSVVNFTVLWDTW